FRHAALNPDGSRALLVCQSSTSGQYFARVWDVVTGQPLTQPLQCEQVPTMNGWLPTFSRDGRRVLTISGGGARVWDAASGQPLTPSLRCQTLTSPQKPCRVVDAAFSPDGWRVVTAGTDGITQVWERSEEHTSELQSRG